MKEPIRILSDLHLSHPASRIGSPSQLRPLIEGAQTVIFNGDTIEQRHSKVRDRAEQMLGELKEICGKLGADPVIVRGNHDPKISETDWLDLGPEDEIFVTHGDVLFPHISPWNPKIWDVEDEMDAIREEIGSEQIESDLATALEATQRCRLLSRGELERFNFKYFKKLGAALALVLPLRRPIEILRCWIETPGRAREFLSRHRPGARFFLFGHTHRPGVWQKGGKGPILINTGGFLSIGKAKVVEISGGKIMVHGIDESGPAFAIGKKSAEFVI
ncbi:MAG: metallophosphoesterase [Verrucomicrobiales bacterium]|nr:metallophosphoesterase [Verrucomicrobiales bacterium]